MKKLKLAIVLAGLFVTVTANAQTKIGYLRIDEIVGLLPELSPQKISMDTVGQKYVSDSVMPRLNYAQSEYQRKLQEYTDSTKSKAYRDQVLKDLQGLKEELDGADNLIQQVLQYKQQEFLRPYYAKVKKAVDAVAKKKGYTHVLSTDVFLVAPEADDLSAAVAAELNVKLPTQPLNPAAGTGKPPALKPGN
jgi:outer membrane protein